MKECNEDYPLQFFNDRRFKKRKKLFGDTVSPNYSLFGDTVSPNNSLLGDTLLTTLLSSTIR